MKVSELKSILAKIPDDLNESDVALNIAECKLNKHLGSVSIEHIYGITDSFDNKEIKDKKEQKEVKKVYRKIVSKTHPDKLIPLPNNTIKKKLIKQYKEAVNKYRDNDMVGLFDIADELDIKLPEIDESFIIKMENEIKSLKDRIKRYKDSNAWVWYHATGEKAEEILKQIISNL